MLPASAMRLSVEHNTETAAPPSGRATPDPAAPDLSFLTRDVATALRSFFDTIDRITADNPVAIARLQELAGKARLGQLTEAETQRAPVAQAAGAPSGPRRRRGDRFLPEVQAVSDAGGDPPEGRRSFNRRSVPCSSSTAPPSATCSSATRSSRSSPTASR